MKYIFILISFYFTVPDVFPQCNYGNKANVTYAGTEFLLCYAQTEDDYSDIGIFDSNAANIYVIGLYDSTEVEITCRAYPSFRKKTLLQKGETLDYRISEDIDVVIFGSEALTQRVVKVISSQPVYCYTSNGNWGHVAGVPHPYGETMDGYAGLPIQIAGTQYQICSYSNWDQQGLDFPFHSQFTVAAFRDGTHIKIIPSDNARYSKTRAIQEYDLNEGEAVQIQADWVKEGLFDLTGSIIVSNQPVSIFAGNDFAYVPFTQSHRQGAVRGGGHLEESIPPLSTWGKNYVCSWFEPHPRPELFPAEDQLRVLANQDNTVVTINGLAWGTQFQAGEHRDTLMSETMTVTGTKPILAAGYSGSWGASDPTVDASFFTLYPSLDQLYNNYSFCSIKFKDSLISCCTYNYVTVVCHRDAKGTILLDGVAIPLVQYSDITETIGGSLFSKAVIKLSGGTHTLSTNLPPEKGFIITAYGSQLGAGYGYSAGSLLKPLRGIAVVASTAIPVAPGMAKSPEIKFRNIINHNVYLDSSRIIIDNDNGQYSVNTKEVIWQDIGFIPVGNEATLHLKVIPEPQERIKGMVRIYHHTYDWRDLEPVDIPFIIEPHSSLMVTGERDKFYGLSVTPNPAFSAINAQFNPLLQPTQFEVVDALGRSIHWVRIMAGATLLYLDLQKYPSGIYFARLGDETIKFIKE